MKTSTKKIFFIVFLINTIALIGYVFLFDKVRGKNEEVYILSEDLNNKMIEESELKLISDNLKETITEREKINSYFVQQGKGGVAKFVEDIENISDLAGVSLKVNSIILKQEEDEKEDIIEGMKLSLITKGDWNELILFLEFLSSSPYNIFIDKVYFEKIIDENSRQWEGLFNLTVFKLSDK